MSFLCKCDEECFQFTNHSTGEIIYTCDQFDEDQNCLECDYRHVQFIHEIPIPIIYEKKTFPRPKKQSKEKQIKQLAESFLRNQRFSYIQELEFLTGIKYKGGPIIEFIHKFL